MNTPFLEPFKLIINPESQTESIVEDGLSCIGILSSLAQDCSNLLVTTQQGGSPSQQMINQLNYAISVIAGLTSDISDLLVSEEIQRSE